MSYVITVRSIVRAFLVSAGYDGLCHRDAECACELADLFPCESEGVEQCQPGYRTPCNCGEGHGFHIDPKRPEATT